MYIIFISDQFRIYSECYKHQKINTWNLLVRLQTRTGMKQGHFMFLKDVLRLFFFNETRITSAISAWYWDIHYFPVLILSSHIEVRGLSLSELLSFMLRRQAFFLQAFRIGNVFCKRHLLILLYHSQQKMDGVCILSFNDSTQVFSKYFPTNKKTTTETPPPPPPPHK